MQTGLFPDISVYAAKRDLLFGNGTALKGFSLYVIILKNKSEFGGVIDENCRSYRKQKTIS